MWSRYYLIQIVHCYYIYLLQLTKDGTAKINLCKTEKPFDTTELGLPFHISSTMHQNRELSFGLLEYDIYALGSLLWVLCEGTGNRGPKAYAECQNITTMKDAVCKDGIKPERPENTPDAWWDLMCKCWKTEVVIGDVLQALEIIHIPIE